jgi:hypothetical protein
VKVDEGMLHDYYKTLDTPILHFGNKVLFYAREDRWHNLTSYDLVTHEHKIIEGF